MKRWYLSRIRGDPPTQTILEDQGRTYRRSPNTGKINVEYNLSSAAVTFCVVIFVCCY